MAHELDITGAPVEAGALYCEVYSNERGPGEHGFGRLFWWGSDGVAYDADSGDMIRLDGDTQIRQTGAFNPDYVFEAAA